MGVITMQAASDPIHARDSSSGQRIVLLATSISYVLVILDTSIVNVALENIAQGLGISVAGLEWVVTAYVIFFSSLVMSGGALGDVFGARRVYAVGLALFAAGSLICGSAPSLALLIAGRIVQGGGAALLVPNALSLIRHAYPDDAARAKAIASWASAGGAAQVLGPLVGGALIAALDWRILFLVNLPICAAGLWLTARTAPGPAGRGGHRLDLPGQLSLTVAMVLVTGALIEAPGLGWDRGWILAAIALGAVSALGFVIVERRSRSPLLPLVLFRPSAFRRIVAAILMGSAVFFGMLFALSLHFLRGAGLTPLETGLAMMPLAVSATIGNLAAARLARRARPITLMLAGAALRLFALAGLAAAIGEPGRLAVAGPLALMGLGAGLSNPMTLSVMLAAADRNQAGLVSGIATATGQLGAAIGVAVFGALLAAAPATAGGVRTASVLSAVVTGLIILILRPLWQPQDRPRGA